MFVLPAKRLPIDRSLLVISAEILDLLAQPMTVSRLWSKLTKQRIGNNQTLITFDWFVLALDFLYALNGIILEQGILVKQHKKNDPSNI